MRFSIWAAVSTEKQTDNASLAEQEAKSRAVATAKGWQDTGLTYQVPGESRTRWVNLRDAERAIPALASMLDDAKGGRYDLLVLYDYNRLRDLLDPVAKTLSSYGVQLYSVSQPVDPLPPEEYNPYASDSESIMRGMSQIISRWQISDLKRKFRYGVTSRVNRGLHSIRVPFGYRSAPGQKQAPAELVPSQAAYVRKMVDMFLAGETYDAIATMLKENHVSTVTGKPWEITTIRQILINPFYAGKVFFQRWKVINDPHNNTSRRVQNDNYLLMDGRHKAIVTWEEHQAILEEVKRRKSAPKQNRYPYSGLVRCTVCNKSLIHDPSYAVPVWHCPGKYHVLIRHEHLSALAPRLLQKALHDVQPGAPMQTEPAPDPTPELEKQRRRVQAAYESELYTLEEAEGKIREIDKRIHAYKNGEAERLRRDTIRKQFSVTLEQARALLAYLPEWMQAEEPRIVNRLLLRLCHISISPDLEMKVIFRG
jgi:DNA invertase Pin-like site-specific DNA recombinase